MAQSDGVYAKLGTLFFIVVFFVGLTLLNLVKLEFIFALCAHHCSHFM